MDREAANRFIRAAISDATKNAPADEQNNMSSSTPPVGKHTRFTHLAPAKSTSTPAPRGENQEDESSSDDDDVVVYGDNSVTTNVSSASGTDPAHKPGISALAASRKRAMDPFQGKHSCIRRLVNHSCQDRLRRFGRLKTGGLEQYETLFAISNLVFI